MKVRISVLCILALLLVAMLCSAGWAEEDTPKLFVPDKALCAKMLRFGKQAYERGRYLDAKVYFRKAVQADPMSETAWKHYDQATIFALAEKVEKNTGLISPDSSVRQETTGGQEPPTAPPPATPVPQEKKETFVIKEDEGC